MSFVKKLPESAIAQLNAEYTRQQQVYEQIAKDNNLRKEDIESHFRELSGAKAAFFSTKRKNRPSSSNAYLSEAKKIAKKEKKGKIDVVEVRKKYDKLSDEDKKALKTAAENASKNEAAANRNYNMECAFNSMQNIMDVLHHEYGTESVFSCCTFTVEDRDSAALCSGTSAEVFLKDLTNSSAFVKFKDALVPAGYAQEKKTSGTPPRIKEYNDFRTSVTHKIASILAAKGYIEEGANIRWTKFFLAGTTPTEKDQCIAVSNWPSGVPFKTVSTMSKQNALDLEAAFDSEVPPSFNKI